MDTYDGKYAGAQDAQLDKSIRDGIKRRYDELPQYQRAIIDREAQVLHLLIKELADQTVAREIIWAIGLKINECTANGGKAK